MDDETILILAAAGIGIYALNKFSEPLGDALGGAGAAISGVGEGVSTIGKETGETVAAALDPFQAASELFTNMIKGLNISITTPYGGGGSSVTNPSGSSSVTLTDPAAQLFPTAQAQISADMAALNDAIVAQSNIKTEYIVRGGQLVAVPFDSQVTTAEREATNALISKALPKTSTSSLTVRNVVARKGNTVLYESGKSLKNRLAGGR